METFKNYNKICSISCRAKNKIKFKSGKKNANENSLKTRKKNQNY